MDHLEKAPKAYHNLDFMNSPFARPVRLLTEYIEPYARMKYVDIKDTIVFFGSARILPKDKAHKDYEDVKKRYN
ncbi:MAG TPA: lysine decarboxylase, partial [Ignavibacteria bacterium]